MSLCADCGLCCDGTLFTRVPLLEVEVESYRVPLQVLPGQYHAPQPCPALDGTRCRIYADRPTVCSRYRCLLLEAHEADEVDLSGAAQVVARAKTARARLAAAVQAPDGGAVVEAARSRRESLPPEARQALEQLEALLTFHFLGQRDRLR